MDVFVFSVRLLIADGICGGQQLHGTGGNESNERVLRREYFANKSNEFCQQWKCSCRRTKGAFFSILFFSLLHAFYHKSQIYFDSLQLSNDHRPSLAPQYDTFCHGRATALYIDKFSRFFFPFSFVILNILYWTTFL